MIKEPNKLEVRMRSSDIAKIGTKNERDTDLAQYADKRPPKVHEKTLQQNMKNHKYDLIRKELVSKRIKRSRKQPDAVSVISSSRYCISTTNNVARAFKIHIHKKIPKRDEAIKKTPDFTQILHFSPIKPIASPPTPPSLPRTSAP